TSSKVSAGSVRSIRCGADATPDNRSGPSRVSRFPIVQLSARCGGGGGEQRRVLRGLIDAQLPANFGERKLEQAFPVGSNERRNTAAAAPCLPAQLYRIDVAFAPAAPCSHHHDECD